MIAEDLKLLEGIWHRMGDRRFDIHRIVRRILNDAGIDMKNVSEKSMVSLIDSGTSEDVRDITWGLSEMLSHYVVYHQFHSEADGETVAAWVLTLLLLADFLEEEHVEAEDVIMGIRQSIGEFEKYLLPHEMDYLLKKLFSSDEGHQGGLKWFGAN